MIPKFNNSTKEEVKRRKSAQINNFPLINFLVNNLNTSYKSTSDLGSPQPLFNSNSLFAYQELDQFSSFCDEGSIPSELISEKNKNGQANNINLNNSTKLEECEQSDSSDESSDNNNDMSEDDFMMKKNRQRQNKRKSAFYMIPSYLKNLSSNNIPNESIYNNNNISNSDKKVNKNVNKNNFNNNCINSNSNNFVLNSGSCPYNIRRGSNPANQFRKDLLFNDILCDNQNKYIFLPNNIEANNNNLSKINNNTNNNITNNINNINNNTINFMSNMQNPNQSNFQNFKFVPNFPYNNNFFNNNANNNNIINNQNINPKKRNSQKVNNQIPIFPSQISANRRGSHQIASNFQISTNEKQNDKNKNILKEENPSYFLQDQLYCRQIQTKLEKNVKNLKYTEEFYEDIKPRLIEIIEHQFGNYVIQKFLEVLLSQGNKQIFENIFLDINEKLFSICIHNYGTRVIQKTLEKLDKGNYSKIETEKLNSVFQNMIEKHLYELCCDKNGNHVYQKLLKIFPKENNKNDFLYDELIKINFKVSIIQQGATLLNVALEQGSENQKEKLCEAIVDNIGDLIIDKYGNYTIQTVFKIMNEKVNEKIYKYIDENLLKLSKEKFSSNVIDKCIIKDYEPSKKLIQSIIDKNIIKDIIVDQYGNYVVQKALNVSDRDTCKKIFEQIRPLLGELHKTNIGKKIYDKLWQNYKDFFD